MKRLIPFLLLLVTSTAFAATGLNKMKKLIALLVLNVLLISAPAFAATSAVERTGSGGFRDGGSSVYTKDSTDTVKIGGARHINYDLTSALVSYYKMEDNAATGTVVDELSANNCTVVNTENDWSSDLHAVGGKLGDYFDFTTASSEYLDCGSNASLKFTLDFSVAVWIRTTATNDDIAGNRNSSGSSNGWSLEMVNSPTQAPYLTVDTSDGTFTLSGTTDLHDGNWKFVVAQVKNGNLQLYVNGVREGLTTTNATGSMVGDANKTYIGRSFNTVDYWGGDMDNFMLFNRGLTQDEIDALYSNGAGTISSSGVAGSTTNIIGSTTVVNSSHSLTSSADLVIQGSLEVQGVGYFDGGVYSSGTIGCVLLTDTDSAGYTECTALNGVLSCTVDADGVCDGV